MTYEVTIGGRTRRIGVERKSGGFVVTVDGRRHAADVTVINGVWSLIVESDARGIRRSHELTIFEQPPGSGVLAVHIDGRTISATVGATNDRGLRRLDSAAGGAGHTSSAPQPVRAPMPGKVVKVLVRPGEAVAARQGVVVVEAMKMENELRSPKAGTVTEIKVAEGASVEAGAVLAVIE